MAIFTSNFQAQSEVHVATALWYLFMHFGIIFSGGRIAAVVIALLVFLALCGVGGFFLYKKKIKPWWESRDTTKIGKPPTIT